MNRFLLAFAWQQKQNNWQNFAYVVKNCNNKVYFFKNKSLFLFYTKVIFGHGLYKEYFFFSLIKAFAFAGDVRRILCELGAKCGGRRFEFYLNRVKFLGHMHKLLILQANRKTFIK
jgi:hypothetical protein